MGVLLLLLLTGITGAVLLDRAGPDPSAGTGSSTDTPSPEQAGEPGTSATTSATPSPTRSSAPPSSSGTPPKSDPGAARTVADYYTLLPGNTRSAWKMLGKDARAEAGGYDGYVGFWSTIDDVSVRAVSTDGDVVTARLTYTTGRGQEEETRRLQVERTGNDWLITEDLGPVSS